MRNPQIMSTLIGKTLLSLLPCSWASLKQVFPLAEHSFGKSKHNLFENSSMSLQGFQGQISFHLYVLVTCEASHFPPSHSKRATWTQGTIHTYVHSCMNSSHCFLLYHLDPTYVLDKFFSIHILQNLTKQFLAKYS